MVVITSNQEITGMIRFIGNPHHAPKWTNGLYISDPVGQSIEHFIQSGLARNDERPSKRRKFVQDTSETSVPVERNFVFDQNVVLCRITINLVSLVSRGASPCH